MRLWQKAKGQVEQSKGCLIIDDSTLDKLYSRKIEFVTRHWSGKHERVVSGINLVTVLWTDGERYIPVSELDRLKYAEFAWMIETYYRSIKQFCGVERCPAHSETAQRNHIELALRAFLCLEYRYFIKGISWFEAKTDIVRDAVRAYLANPLYTF